MGRKPTTAEDGVGVFAPAICMKTKVKDDEKDVVSPSFPCREDTAGVGVMSGKGMP